jgi:hypothetical protein
MTKYLVNDSSIEYFWFSDKSFLMFGASFVYFLCTWMHSNEFRVLNKKRFVCYVYLMYNVNTK